MKTEKNLKRKRWKEKRRQICNLWFRQTYFHIFTIRVSKSGSNVGKMQGSWKKLRFFPRAGISGCGMPGGIMEAEKKGEEAAETQLPS